MNKGGAPSGQLRRKDCGIRRRRKPPMARPRGRRVPKALTRILVVYCFCTLTVKPRLWLMTYQRNQNNLDFFAQLALVILRGQWG
jgi:hypothetical protein